jgi:hypothetical protein
MPRGEIAELVDTFPCDASDQYLLEELDSHHAKDLRRACVELKLGAQARSSTFNNKVGYIDLLCGYHRSRQEGVALGMTGPSKAPNTVDRRTKHSAFRLANVIFSDTFIDRIGEMDKQPSRQELDVGAVNDKSKYWCDVAAAFASNNPEFDKMIASRAEYADITPKDAPSHSASKLRRLWKDLTALHGTALSNSQQSGTHDSDFFKFCGGRVDVLYVHDWLLVRPEQLAIVEAKLPERARLNTLDSSCDGDDYSDGSDRLPAKRKRPSTVDRILDMISEERAHAAHQRVSSFASIKESSQAVRDAMGAIEALKNANFNPAIVDDAKHKMDALVTKWLIELEKVND